MTASDKCHHVSPERRRTEAAAAQTRSRDLLPTIFNIAEGYVILTNPPHPPNIHLCVCFLFFSFFLLTHSSLSRGKTRHRSPAIPVLLMPRRCHLGAPVAPRRRCAGRVCVCVCCLSAEGISHVSMNTQTAMCFCTRRWSGHLVRKRPSSAKGKFQKSRRHQISLQTVNQREITKC